MRITLATLVLAAMVSLVWASADSSVMGGSVLQACPSVNEEIVDLQILADGLKQSDAVGLFEKIRLKSSIDDLLRRMKKFHNGAGKYSEVQLQEQYDVLLMRIATHLQDKDTILHSRLCNAWEMIWQDLADPDRFAEKFS